ncbi:hypothetical protein [Mycobacterium sp. 852002-51961_SCH5331710]|uniref:hypothetical protein n=1 Tax=Mycobacterium sp. 852002-51961_SCH5331710 TaxID=1834105 RepID=UPI0007FBFC76|nr:hypothetical protein [Mycobacterium sp. 852002-51961_SCH5331710]OBB36604.1 hypothetical protein A5752_15865 [Mycobacterium sp. 852002-51961_SCH5331710]
MGILLGLAPWIVYWVLVGNVPFTVAVLIALAVAVAGFTLGQLRGGPGRILEIGAVATFLVLTVLTFALDESFLERWIFPLSNLGIFLVALTGVLIGKPFVREFAEAGQQAHVVKSDLFARITSQLSWIWVAAFGGMTVASAIPPIVDRDATVLDTETPLSFLCYWVIPFALVAAAAFATRVLPDRIAAGADDIVRKTSFVAFAEAEIDQLIYLATEHANREVGPGKEAFDIKIGSKGIPLTGDETRESWPSTYKVRDKKR